MKRKDDSESDDESRAKYAIVGGESTVDEIRATLDREEDDDD
ncbi:uncharacterized protein Nmag_4253 (plasmid) [Natrialba magadii ATCC 43099]|uniref:Uncharacterized protein n=2 Tax=root TaxID=1 RepID=D3T2F2_NATMM|nr:hypothetical protein [Natrialba magadii]ADD07761.1 uncharacterized protein Nmag_4253 [Natrialba magadii ATCC 43099]ELY23008.1 hypothetical protein C500_21130 [Natrialba magadii ATCC 43099]